MSGWVWVVVLNGITAAAYLGIVLFIVRGLMRTGQLRNNRLAVATAAIFLTCAAHHLVHAVHLWTGFDGHASHLAAGSGGGMLDAMRESMGGPLDVAVTASTALAGVIYLGMRRFYGPLLRSPAMFDDASEARYRQLAANLPHTSVLVVDCDLRFVLVEGAGLVAEGYAPRRMEGQLLRDTVSPEAFALLEPHYLAAVAGEEISFDSVSPRTGAIFQVEARPLRDDSGRIVGAMVLSEDVSAERAALAELEQARAFRDAVLTASPDITTVTAVDTGRVTWASRSLRSLLTGPPSDGAVEDGRVPWLGLGRSDDSTDGEDRLDGVVEQDVEVVRAADRTAASLPEGESVSIRYRVLAADGSLRWLSRRTTPFRRGPSGEVSEVLSVVREVTDVVEAELALERAALQDPLTGLPNRMLLLDRIGSAIARGESTGAAAAVLFCDLDGFKRVNDTGGHAAGDAVLVEVARRLRSVLRANDSIARVGGDEFVLVVDALPAERGTDKRAGAGLAERVAERIRAVLAAPIVYQGSQYVVSASVGMVLVRKGASAQEVLRDADSAMYRAKQLGKDRIELFDDALRANALERAYIERTLRSALDPEHRGAARLNVVYQPVYDLNSRALTSFEALARLRDDDGAGITPDRFIPVAEDTGLISELGERVLDDALGTLVRWRAANPRDSDSGVPVQIAVNLSARQAQHVDMAAVVSAALGRHRMAPADLILELTESVLLESGSSMLRQLGELRELGVGIAIDDFGTGFASLRYLATLPVSAVKIDRSFTATMTSDETSSSIVRAIINLARDLHLGCVVEGIETPDQLDALPSFVQGQGYLLGRPAEVPTNTWVS
ncbi:EAL domain-containing protein [Rhodococcus sp. IEGM 1401]|uniref:putative bifunctional diguanylate cyclase/phosphodiesterase n=1 Tax=unclassified Rhodococcus (in: high G+C Gram-positive bacteria) TaxID=192944 RepID=UPI0022B3F522|nr:MULTISPECIES: EAL domain-containing protein [unclassified Rhodococcus (in: high G+C Gram-positive bacteria)]MCZ4562925.1 EAL domain-containing protein [Rhodococcus sp. IEGM 1401]MDI9923044.1 EAL domain-containing protein [Rhodococcus sp. IEGM 1372]MDV8035595.1 EAL domain-containing protein [Rhodococcus sp. IEGM 1414]